jgi:hypothetical protein
MFLFCSISLIGDRVKGKEVRLESFVRTFRYFVRQRNEA